MRIFKSVDEKLKEIGFNKTREDKYGATYERYIAKYSPTFPWKNRIGVIGNIFDNPELLESEE